MKGLIFDIRHYAVHDGPGIRTTVFMKGCPLACHWCHNPESRLASAEPIITKRRIGEKVFDETETVGNRMTPHEVLQEVKKSGLFFDESGGGITFSGGEPMLQSEFLVEALKLCRAQEIHTAVDTCGYAPFSSFEKIMDYVDVFLYDIKLMDNELHKEYVGTDNILILENLIKLSERGANINLRIPVIGGINDDNKTMESIIKLIENTNISDVNLLPYHDIAKNKYSKLGKEYKEDLMSKPSEERMEEIKKMFEKNGYKVKIGG